MPHISVTMFPGRDYKTKMNFSKALQEFAAQQLHISPDVVSVSVEDIEKEDWAGFIKNIPEETIFVAQKG